MERLENFTESVAGTEFNLGLELTGLIITHNKPILCD